MSKIYYDYVSLSTLRTGDLIYFEKFSYPYPDSILNFDCLIVLDIKSNQMTLFSTKECLVSTLLIHREDVICLVTRLSECL